ncbi:OmpA family protein [Pseudomarimonas arenosa]|uniref:OmpA family protein n=1 Tax=Pseudomarimonas arenosa TaxID=2774145 RepID=A0AAW3ZPZ4_9GAMM|nr:OmpA family protein [Pseudomarimonas arenosa]MBD8528273.1 OmpA family protein [Pseudomarimonas arenosa]
MSKFKTSRALLVSGLALSLGACSNYVKRTDFDAAMNELRARDSAIEAKADANASALAALRTSLEARLKQHEAKLAELAGRLHVDMNVHFAYDKAEVRDQDKATLDKFAKVIREHHSNAKVTVEGFTDAAGDAGYNKRLGKRRADAVRDYLVQQGLSAEQVVAVSYGESRERQQSPGAWGDNGLANRRVTLVVDVPPAT